MLHFERYIGLTKISNSNVTSKVTEGHWCCCHSIGHIRFPTSLPLHYVSISHRFRDIIAYFPKILKRSRDPKHIVFRDSPSRIHYYSSISISTTNLKCLSSPIPKIHRNAEYTAWAIILWTSYAVHS